MADESSNLEAMAASVRLHVAGTAPKRSRSKARKAAMWVTYWLRGWSHEHFSRESVLTFFKTLLWVAPLTVLIWVYAERQGVVATDPITIPVQVVSSDPNKVIRMIKPDSGNIMVTLKGSKTAIEKLRAQLNPLAGNPAAQIVLENTTSDADQRINSRRIQEDKRFAQAGIIVQSAEPPEIRVLVDPLVEEKVPVQSDTKLLKTPVFDPPMVTVRCPASVIREQKAANNFYLKADLASRLSPSPATSEQEIVLNDVKLSLPFENKNVTLSQSTVTARVEPTKPVEHTFNTLRVVIVAPESLLKSYDMTPPPTLVDVKVSGAPELIEKISGGVAPRAFLEIPAGDYGEGTTIDVPVKYYDFPEDVSIKEGPKTLKVTLTRRS